MRAWRSAGAALESVRRDELRSLDGQKALALLTGPADCRQKPRETIDVDVTLLTSMRNSL